MIITESQLRSYIQQQILQNPHMTLEEINEVSWKNIARNLGMAAALHGAAGAGVGAEAKPFNPFPDQPKISMSSSDSRFKYIDDDMKDAYKELVDLQKSLRIDDKHFSAEQLNSINKKFKSLNKKISLQIISIRRAINSGDMSKSIKQLEKLESICNDAGNELINTYQAMGAAAKTAKEKADLEMINKEMKKTDAELKQLKGVIKDMKNMGI